MSIDPIEQYGKDLSPERRELLRLLLAEKAKAKQGAEAEKRAARQPIARRDPALPAILSLAQERLWFLDQLNPGNPAYAVPALVRLEGRLDIPVFTRALAEVMRRHETLRTSFAAGQGRPVQIVAPSLPALLPLVDLSGLPAAARSGRVDEIARESTRTPFDLGRAPIFRMALLRLNGEEHVVLLTIHHIIGDQWSINILVQELGLLYSAFLAGRPSPLPEPAVQYADFAVWQREWLRRTSLDEDLGFWKGALASAPGVLDLPTDRPRPPVQSFWGAKRFIAFPRGLTAELKSLARGEGASLFMTLLAALYALLFRTTGQDDVVVGTPVANRNRPELEGVIGPLLNTLLLRGDLAGNPTFRDLLARVREMTIGAFQHQDLPFEKLLEELQPERTMSRNPLFQVTFVLQTAPRGELRAPGLIFAPFDVDAGTVQLDLTLLLVETPEGLSGWLEYDTDLFQAATIDRQIGHLRNLLEGVARDPGQRLRALPMLSSQEWQQVVWGWNDTDAPYERGLTMHRLFERQAERTPEAPAAECGEDRLTYAELNARANQLAHHLIGMGAGHGLPVGLHLGRGLHDLVALLGILKAGGAYVPIDVGQPPARIEAIVRTAGITTLVTETPRAEMVRGLGERLRQVVWMDALDVAAQPVTNPAPRVDAETLAYVIFTSGSTGTPKGVMVRHRPVINLIEWVNRTFEVGPGDRVLFITALSFDLSVYDVFGILAAGGTIRMASEAELREPESLVRILVEEPITFWDSAPAALQQLAPFLPTEPVPGSRLRLVFQSGDWIPVTLPDRVRAAFPGAQMVSLGGATEATVWSNWFPVREVPRWWASIPYGRPIQNARYYVLDAELRPLPIGAPGDLYIGGECLSSGYLDRPDGTADQYIPDPFNAEPGARLYKTGDQARFWADGNLEFLGRRDHQVKVRGYRIELGEIQAALALHPDVREAAVLALPGAGGEKRLVAWFAPRAEGEAPAVPALRAWLLARLPEYMVPSAFVPLAALPVTANGKLDRKALPAPEGARTEAADAGAAPRNPAEEVIASIWAEVLEIERVGVFDNLFELGAHSLLATQVVSRIRDSLGVDLPLRTLFEEPTVAGQTERAMAARAQSEGVQLPPVVPVPRDGKLPLAFTQERLWFLQQMSPTMSAYNAPGAVLLEGEVDPVAMERAVRELLLRHEVFRTSYPAVNGEPSQVIADEVPFDLPVLDLRALPAAERRRRSLEAVAGEARRPFDLSRVPLLRVYLMHLGEREHMLGVVTHHIVYDMWAREVFIRELGQIYAAFAAGHPSPLPNLPVQYADFAVWQRTWMQGEGLESQLAYWREKLAGAPPAAELPGDRPRPAVQTFVGARTYLTVQPALAQEVQTLARREGLTVFMVLLAGFKTVLARTLGQDRIVVGMPIANRNRVEVEGLIGFFANTLVLYTDLSGNPSFREALGRVRETALGSYTHQDMPFEYLVQELRPPRDMSRTPLFQLMFNYLPNYALRPLEVPGLKLTPQEVHNSGAPFDLDLNMWPTTQGFRGAADYNTDLFDRTTMIRLLRHFETLLAGVVAEPGRPLSELPLLPASERHQVLREWNDAAAEVPSGAGFQQIFESQVDRTPSAVAAVCQGMEVTYAELDRRADIVAAGLVRQGVGPGVVVALLAERGLDFLAAVLGVFKAGGAYLPLDPRYPARRHVQVLQQSDAPVLVTTAELVPFVEEALSLMPEDRRPDALLALEDLLALPAAGRPPARATERDLAYVIYTSGSTGVPKGVMIEHRGMINHLWAKILGLPLGASDRIAQTASQTFDISVWQLLAALVLGGRVEIFPDEVAQDPQRLLEGVERGQVTVLETVPSLLRVLVEEAERGAVRPGLASLRWMIPTGEALPPELTTAWLRLYPQIPLLNAYGPTECSDDVTHAVVRAWPEESAPPRVPIGRTVTNLHLHVVDRLLQPLPIGVPGELCVGGAGVGRGYLGEPARTADVFVPDPFAADPGARMYRTGDLVRQLTDGTFDFLGRIDHQVKVRGFRIELGEIEAVLAEHPGVRQAVVVTRELEGAHGDPRLVAYVVPADGPAVGSEELRALVGERLPDYMVPAAVVFLESLPLTANGKIDRKALPAPDAAQLAVQVEYVAPRNPVEQALARIWGDLLGVERVGVQDDFFHLGGHSLLAARVVSRVREAFRVELPLATFFEASTLGNLAEAVSVAQWVAGPAAEDVAEYEEIEVGEL